MKSFSVSTDPSYDILIGAGLLQDVGVLTRQYLPLCHVCVITDSTVNSFYGQIVMSSLAAQGYQVSKIVFPAGEHAKTLYTYTNILEALAEEGLTRSDAVVALGGGIVSDLVGFVAATYMRGIACIQIPTTYMAAVDASIGGKSGLNLSSGKNLVGTYWQPSLVICDPATFETLPAGKLLDGKAEAIKYAVLSDASLIPKIQTDQIESVIERCVSIKKSIVEADERSTGLRLLLNFGHTVAHGIEKYSIYSVSHGQAVAKGMVAEARAAFRKGLTKTDISGPLADLLTEQGFDISISNTADEIYQHALMDKKIFADKITVIVPDAIGKCHLQKISLSELKEFIELALD